MNNSTSHHLINFSTIFIPHRISLFIDEYSDSLYSYCSAEDGGPDYVNSADEQELPLRWKAPEVLSEFRFSTASDVWALGVLMYEVLTYGCLPYRHISDNEKLCSQVS